MTVITNGPSDTELIARSLARDSEAFGMLYLRYKDWVYGYALSHTGNAEAASDLVQDIFVKALKSLSQFEQGQNFGAWLNGITQHTTTDYLRRHYRGQARFQPLDENQVFSSDAPIQAALNREILQSVLDGLSAAHRRLIELRLMQGLSTGETALQLYGRDDEDSRRKVTVGLYKAVQAARQGMRDEG